MRSSPRWVVLAMAPAAFLLFAGWLTWKRDHATAGVADGVYGLILVNAFAMCCTANAGLRVRGPQRVAWLCIATGLGGFVTGDLINTAYRLGTGTRLPFPSPVDALYLLLPLSMIAAAVFSPLGGIRASIRLVLDGVIVTASLFIIAWSAKLDELYQATDQIFPGFAVALVFPVADLVLFTMVVLFAIRAAGNARWSAILLAAGVLVIAITNVVAIFSRLPAPQEDASIVISWAFGSILIGAAALTADPMKPPDVGPPRPPTRTSLWLPYVPVPFALVLGLVHIWPLGSAAPVYVGGLILALAALLRQFTLLDENYHLRATVADIALRDPLTGLGNRTLFADRLAHAMQLRFRNAAPVAVLMLDVDDFKLVNDTLGHSAGDALLRSVGERIQEGLRPGDTVARLGGDEFAILVEDSPAVASRIAERVVRAFEEPFVVVGQAVHVRMSIGLATAVGDTDVSAEELFQRADLAMYSAKRAHVSARSFTPDMGSDATELTLPSQNRTRSSGANVPRIQFVEDLRRAIDERQFDLVYQPKIDLKTGLAVGVEALIRWPHPELGLLEPADFLPLVREHGLMETVTDLVLTRAVEDAAGWRAAGVDMPVAINVAAPSLNDETFPAHVMSVLALHGMSPAALTVEITEDTLMASVDQARHVVDRLRESGIRVAIDDFGSGYAAMTYLHELPVDEIKLDRQFIAPILHDQRAAAIVRSVIELADTFGVISVAEGVEDKATADLLANFGCSLAQGHYFSPPVSSGAIGRGVGVTLARAARPSWA